MNLATVSPNLRFPLGGAMYSETNDSRKTLGDVDVLYHDGIFHLFHLVLPNHDFIAHAVSSDGFSWRRVENALFIGHPGSWDDSMLWTMHVSPDPHGLTKWRMFYTGLSRRDAGQKQRLGMAVSDDLYRWTKCPVNWVDRRSPLPYDLPGRPSQPPFEFDPDSDLPLQPPSKYYESETDQGRHWISWRDPFFYHDRGQGYLLCAGRVKEGPIVRRGCVAAMQEVSPGKFKALPALHHPGLYDDIEVPNLLKIDGEYYLIGSIREDAKVRYWHTNEIGQPWRSYHDNVLLASGNYAGRITKDDKGYLLWNFYTADSQERQKNNLMPPPKRLRRLKNGMLRCSSFEGFDQRVTQNNDATKMCPLKTTRHGDQCVVGDGRLELESHSGFQAYLFDDYQDCFRFRARFCQSGQGKMGFVFRIDRETHDGYYLSLDLTKGVAQLRAWGSGEEGSGENMMQFRSLQSAFWNTDEHPDNHFQLIAYGSYIELSIDSRVLLSLSDQTFSTGGVGIYVESAAVRVDNPVLETLRSPVQSDEHLAQG